MILEVYYVVHIKHLNVELFLCKDVDVLKVNCKDLVLLENFYIIDNNINHLIYNFLIKILMIDYNYNMKDNEVINIIVKVLKKDFFVYIHFDNFLNLINKNCIQIVPVY